MAHISKYNDYSLVQLTILNIARMIGSDTEETIVVYSFFPDMLQLWGTISVRKPALDWSLFHNKSAPNLWKCQSHPFDKDL